MPLFGALVSSDDTDETADTLLSLTSTAGQSSTLASEPALGVLSSDAIRTAAAAPSRSIRSSSPVAGGGLPPTACGAYQYEADWLPHAYVQNATCACSTLPDDPKANCIRAFLQNRLSTYPAALKDTLRAAKRSIIPGHYEFAVQTQLTPRIYRDHTDAYKACGCQGRPAPYPDWIGVTTVPLPCPAVHRSILVFGSCSGVTNKW